MIYLVFFNLDCKAQDPYYINLSIAEGLPSYNIYSIHQEENGILWFSTDVGIVKYNSKNFELFNTESGLSDNEVFRLKKDSSGRLWLLTLNGKLSFLYKNKIYNYKNSDLLKKINATGHTVDFLKDSNQNIYIAFKSGDIYQINSNNSITKYNTNKPTFSGIWLSSQHLFGIDSEAIYTIDIGIKKTFKPTNPIRVFHLSNQETLLSDGNVVYKAVNDSLIYQFQLPKKNDIINIIHKKEGLWLCTRNGVILYQDKKVISHYFTDCIVSDVLEDQEGSYWFTTLNKGVLYVPSLGLKQILENTKINTLAVNNNKKELWIGGVENDFYILKEQNLEKKELKTSKALKDKIASIRFFGDTTYVVGKSSLNIFKPNTFQTINISANDILIHQKKLYLGSTFASKMNPDELKDIYSIHKKSILNKRINALNTDSNQTIWLGSNFGLHSYHLSKIKNYGTAYEDLSISIEDLFYDKEKQTLFIATASKGLILLQNNTITNKITLKDGLNSNTVNTIKKIGHNEYLIGSNNGLNHILFSNNKCKISNYNFLLGIKNKRIKDIEKLDNTLYLATDNGLLHFKTSEVSFKKNKPKCHIKSIINEGEEITTSKISYNKNDISIIYEGISYKDKGNLTYYYKLDQIDKKWSSTLETQINYKSLAAKKYNFLLYTVNGAGIKSNIQRIDFEILPPFWNNNWFKLILLLVMGVIIYLLIKIRLNKQQKRFEEEKSKIQLEKYMIELEQKALRMQMNPHFIFNALNTIKGYYLEGDTINASKYISKFSKLLRMLLENEDQITTLENEIDMLQLYIDLTQIRYPNKFEFEIKIAPELQISEIILPNLLLQPIVENAIIHGLAPKKEKGKLNLSFYTENNFLICTVEDNGIGRKESAKKNSVNEHQSKASQIIKDRLNLFDSKCTITYLDLSNKNNISLGTKVVIKLPSKNIWS
tara:strand:+ start:806 stop:3622 length:2817 start_codon:yes stop_codon:yes gene_type:complete